MRYNNRQNPPTHPSRSAPTPSDAASDSVAAARTAPHPSQAMTYRSRGRASQPSEVRRSGSTYAIMKARHATSETACPTIGQARRPPNSAANTRATASTVRSTAYTSAPEEKPTVGADQGRERSFSNLRAVNAPVASHVSLLRGATPDDRLSDTRQLDDAVAPLVRRAQGGDARARDELLRRCHATVYRWPLVHAG